MLLRFNELLRHEFIISIHLENTTCIKFEVVAPLCHKQVCSSFFLPLMGRHVSRKTHLAEADKEINCKGTVGAHSSKSLPLGRRIRSEYVGSPSASAILLLI